MKDSPSKAFPVSPWILLWSVMGVFGVVALILFNAQAANTERIQKVDKNVNAQVQELDKNMAVQIEQWDKRMQIHEESHKALTEKIDTMVGAVTTLVKEFDKHRYLTESRPASIKKAK